MLRSPWIESPTRQSRVHAAGIATLVMALLVPTVAEAQVSGTVEIRQGQGRALVRNPSASPVHVRVALWESDETGEGVELLHEAEAIVWPTDFELPPGEVQTIRIRLEEDAYPAGSRLRLETRIVPAQPERPATTGQTHAQLILATRVLASVLVH